LAPVKPEARPGASIAAPNRPGRWTLGRLGHLPFCSLNFVGAPPAGPSIRQTRASCCMSESVISCRLLLRYYSSTPDRDLTSASAGRGRGFGELRANGTYHAVKRRLHRHKPPALVLFRGAAPDSDSEDLRVASESRATEPPPGGGAGPHSALASEPGPGLGLGAVPVRLRRSGQTCQVYFFNSTRAEVY
jgi:hypothetical protein